MQQQRVTETAACWLYVAARSVSSLETGNVVKPTICLSHMDWQSLNDLT